MLGIDRRAEVFTGQGSQRVGMWSDLHQSAEARKIFQMADEIVGFTLSKLCREGPIEKLTKTENAQPAIVAHSIAAWVTARSLQPELQAIKPRFVLGHSVGEYSALVVAGVIDLETAIYLVRKRGLLIQELSSEGRMAAFHRFDNQEQVLSICQETETEAANFNGPGQIVVSGGVREIEDAIRLAKEMGMLVILLKTSRAFHSSAMRPATEEFKKVLLPIGFKDPVIPVIPNVTAKPSRSGDEIKKAIAEQIVMPVFWYESVRLVLASGVTTFLEFGPEPVLTGLLRRIDPAARGACIKDLESAVKCLYA
ncbi:ACP S-malonyltransferase [Candidatus Daviesbacteria bacterium]|nr:ACP S-malonyltransferase [Candidatus Daviesbacteria bacterium]